MGKRIRKVAYMKNTTVHSVCKNSPSSTTEIPSKEELHHSINSVKDLKTLNLDFGNEHGNQLENNLESHSDTIMMKEEYETEMNTDAKSLGASVYALPESTTCQVCMLSVGEERNFCDGCGSIRHKHCFNTLWPLRGQSHMCTYCKKLQC